MCLVHYACQTDSYSDSENGVASQYAFLLSGARGKVHVKVYGEEEGEEGGKAEL
jgi:hypothetical protein